MADLEEDIDPMTLVEDLRLGQQQIVEIARALSVDSRILIMDEPTSALSATEVEVLFKVIRDLTSRGVSIVYISHHLEEALQITDYAVVLRDGAMTANAEAKDIDLEWIVRNMVGENFDLGSPPTGHAFGETALSIENVSVADAFGSGYSVVDRLSLEVKAGEIVCIYGLMGAGRTELLEAVAGRMPLSGGRVIVEGEDVTRLSIAQRIDRGLVLVPEDRQRDGLVQTMSVGQNLSLASIASFTKAHASVALRRTGGCQRGDRQGSHQDRWWTRADRLAVRWQSAESCHRQDAGDQSACHPSRRAEPRHRYRRKSRGVPPAQRAGRQGPRRHFLHVRGRRMPQHCPPDRGDAARQDFSAVWRRCFKRRDHGRLRRSRACLITEFNGALTMASSDTTPPRSGLFRDGFDLGRLLLEGRAFFALILIIAVFSFLSPYYFSVSNFLIMSSHVAIYGILAIGMLLVILNGGIDLSVGSTLGLQASLPGF
jgi:ABC-type branched-subunit amino acid transport system ATPase component